MMTLFYHLHDRIDGVKKLRHSHPSHGLLYTSTIQGSMPFVYLGNCNRLSGSQNG